MTRHHFRFRLIWIFVGIAMAGAALATIVGVMRQRHHRNINVAQGELGFLQHCIRLYDLDVGEFPTTQQGLRALFSPPRGLPDPSKWMGPYAGYDFPLDPWSNGYRYQRLDTSRFRVYPSGPDGLPDTDDDIELVSSRTERMAGPRDEVRRATTVQQIARA